MLKRNIIFGLIGQGSLIILSLISTRLIFKGLGPDILGIINFAVVLTALLILLADMGVALTIIREVSVHRHNEPQYVNSFISTISLFAWVVFVLTSIVVLLISPFAVQNWLKIEGVDQHSAVCALQIISVSLLIAIPRSVYGALITGYQRVDYWNISNVWAVGIQQTGMIAVLEMGGGLFHVAVWYAVSAFLSLLPFIYISIKLVGARTLVPKYHRGILLRNINFGSRVFLNSILEYFVTQTDRWIVSKLLPVRLLGYYGFAQGLISKGAIVPGAVASAAFPALSQSVGGDNKTHLLTQYNKLQDFCSYIYMPVSAAVVMLGFIVFKYVFNDEIAGLMILPLIFLSFGRVITSTMTVAPSLVVAMKNPGMLARTNMWALIIVVPAMLLLTFKFGLNGAAFSAIIYGVWQLVYFVPRFCAKHLEISSWQWYRHAAVFIIFGMLCYSIPWFFAWIMGEAFTTAGLIVSYLCGTALFLFGGWFLINDELKKTLSNTFYQVLSVFLVQNRE